MKCLIAWLLASAADRNASTSHVLSTDSLPIPQLPLQPDLWTLVRGSFLI